MEAKIFSFSVKTVADKELVDKLKADAARTGRSFSFIILSALRAQEMRNEQKA